jgi:hypothetical protein
MIRPTWYSHMFLKYVYEPNSWSRASFSLTLSDTIIRGTQIRTKNPLCLPNQTLIYPVKGKNQLNPQTNSSLAGPPASRVSIPAHLTTSSEASRRGVSEHLQLARDLNAGSRAHANEQHHHHLVRTPETTLSVSASPETGLWCRSSIGALETPRDVTHIFASTQPDKSGMTGVKSWCRRP